MTVFKHIGFERQSPGFDEMIAVGELVCNRVFHVVILLLISEK